MTRLKAFLLGTVLMEAVLREYEVVGMDPCPSLCYD